MRVFVLGAGASRSCGLPLTNDLLPDVLPSIDRPATRTRLLDFIEYMYPYFNVAWRNYPNLEELLSLFDVYVEFSPTVKRKHAFSNTEVEEIKKELLRAISIYLCEQVAEVNIRKTSLFDLVRRVSRGDVLITFNWDFTLEMALEALGSIDSMSYKLANGKITLLKPHGSVDWFDSKEVHLPADRTFKLMPGSGRIRVFTYFRFPKVERRIVPVIIPPVLKKQFTDPEFLVIWRDTWKALRRADEIHIIGFSLPPEDLHVRFIMRSAIRANERSRTGGLRITVVNPDRAVFLRFARLVRSPVEYLESRLEGISPGKLLQVKA